MDEMALAVGEAIRNMIQMGIAKNASEAADMIIKYLRRNKNNES